MRFMMIMIPGNVDEANWTPSAEAVAAMSKYNEELTKAGVLLALDGLHPSSKGARVSFAGGKATVTDGPFTEAKEIDRRLLADPGEVQGGGGRVGVALPGGGRRRDRGSPGLRDVGLPARGPGGRGASRAPELARRGAGATERWPRRLPIPIARSTRSGGSSRRG